MKDALCDDECVEVDQGYRGDDKLKNPNILQSRKDRIQKSTVRLRHENVNGRLKQFSVLDQVFRHPLCQHEPAFEAVAVITQLGFELHDHLYSVDYNPTY